MTEDEILAEIAIVSQAIKDVLQAGEEYENQSSSSRRRTRWSSLKEMRAYRSELYAELDTIRGGGSFPLTF